jgi:hypothetical protein
MREVKMVSIEELEDKIHEEEVKARYDSIDTELLNELDKARQWYVNYTKKEYHPISHQLEVEERSAPQFGLTDKYVEESIDEFYMMSIGVMALSYSIGFAFFISLMSALFGN